MSTKPETTFIASVHKHLPRDLYSMKNHNVYNGGIADVWYDDVRDMWIEYKFIVIPKRDTTVIDLVGGKDPTISVLQQNWLRDRHENGRQVAVVVGCKEGGVWFSGTSWDFTWTTEEFKRRLRTRKEIAQIITELVRG